MIFDNILQAVGNTPLIRLQRMTGDGSAAILVKYEGLNVGGSIKTRTALNMVLDAERSGKLQSGSVIVEPTSGNQGIGLALVGAVRGYRVILVMPDSVSAERKKLIEFYGAEVRLVPDRGDIGECIAECLALAERIAGEEPNAFLPQQFVNPANPEVHRNETARELLEQACGSIDGFCSGIGTGGTISGIGEVLKAHNPNIEIWAVEPQNAAILSGGPISSHLQMGIGDGLIPGNLNTAIYSDVCVVSDTDAITTAKQLARLEGIVTGITGGTNVYAAKQLAAKLGEGKTVVTILPDTAERYFTTPLFD